MEQWVRKGLYTQPNAPQQEFKMDGIITLYRKYYLFFYFLHMHILFLRARNQKVPLKHTAWALRECREIFLKPREALWIVTEIQNV